MKHKYDNYENCYKAVENRGLNIQYVPDEFLDSKLLSAAVDNNPWAINYIKDKQNNPIIDEDICIKAVCRNALLIAYIPERFKTNDIHLEAVKAHGMSLKFIEDKYKTIPICIEAIKNNVTAIHYIPNELKNNGFYIEVLKDNPTAIKYIDKDHRSDDICLIAILSYYNNNDISLEDTIKKFDSYIPNGCSNSLINNLKEKYILN